MEYKIIEIDTEDSYKSLGEITKEYLAQGYEFLQYSKRFPLTGVRKVNILTKDNVIVEIIGKKR